MEADHTPVQQSLGGESLESAALETTSLGPRRPSLLDVLLPATPPTPKNARVVRLFDYEAAKNDPQPQSESDGLRSEAQPAAEAQAATADQPKAKPEGRSREAAKAARNQSLLAAAGFLR